KMNHPTKWERQEIGWSAAVEEDARIYDHTVNMAGNAIKELERCRFIKEGQPVAIFLNPEDEIIADDPNDDLVVEQIAQQYARGPEDDPDGPEVPLPEPISIPQALGAVETLRGFAERQKEDYRDLLRQLASMEREMKALQVANRTQITLDSFFIDK